MPVGKAPLAIEVALIKDTVILTLFGDEAFDALNKEVLGLSLSDIDEHYQKAMARAQQAQIKELRFPMTLIPFLIKEQKPEGLSIDGAIMAFQQMLQEKSLAYFERGKSAAVEYEAKDNIYCIRYHFDVSQNDDVVNDAISKLIHVMGIYPRYTIAQSSN
jgi:hypothetical protein